MTTMVAPLKTAVVKNSTQQQTPLKRKETNYLKQNDNIAFGDEGDSPVRQTFGLIKKTIQEDFDFLFHNKKMIARFSVYGILTKAFTNETITGHAVNLVSFLVKLAKVAMKQ